ncbi:NAD-dependent protein deacylase [Mycoplasmopsis primatum]|uniref:NAD-dependent protein deacylase n=1 Tax=Mycoplasmopsis primatum TaxID=55604 RepID=UPI001F3DC01B|nr:NAD-dependent protein deacylase [Mycoplasmopsis primatum]
MQFKLWIKNAKRIVFFSGAGVSVASGLPDFRGTNGLYNKKFNGYNPENILSHSFFVSHPKMFYEYYYSQMFNKDIKPNIIHKTVATWCKDKDSKNIVITQNIDNLDRLAGNTNVIEIHGNANINYCTKCSAKYDFIETKKLAMLNDFIPLCLDCKSIIKPDVVLYEEPLNSDSINKTIEYISNADLLIVAGTSLNVYPASSFLQFYNGKKIVVLNKEDIQQKVIYKNDLDVDLIYFNEDIKYVFENL